MLRECTQNFWQHRELLLLADPDEDMINRYLGSCRLLEYVLEEQVVGIAAFCPLEDGSWELKNLAVAPEYQNRGIGKRLVKGVLEQLFAKGIPAVWVGTASSSPKAIRFYQSCGFAEDHILKNFFVDNYPEPVFDDGIQCVDMIYLKAEPRKQQ